MTSVLVPTCIPLCNTIPRYTNERSSSLTHYLIQSASSKCNTAKSASEQPAAIDETRRDEQR